MAAFGKFAFRDERRGFWWDRGTASLGLAKHEPNLRWRVPAFGDVLKLLGREIARMTTFVLAVIFIDARSACSVK